MNTQPSLNFLKGIIITALFLTLLFAAGYVRAAGPKPKPLCTCWYTYKKLVRKGYKPVKFKGSQFITFAKYQQLLAATKAN
jgi:hypothetical protein